MSLQFNRDDIARFGALAAYVLVTVFLSANHEPWRDEADPWLYVRDSGLQSIIGRSAYAGFPSLWFLVLALFVKVGLPYATQKVLHLCIASATVAVILWKSPLKMPTRLLLTFSYFFAYEYAVVVRAYALSILLLMIAASFYATRLTKPIRYGLVLALAANVTSQVAIIAAMLSVLLLFELSRIVETRSRRTALVGWAILTIGTAAAFAQLRTPPDYNLQGLFRAYYPFNFIREIGEAFLPRLPLLLSIPAGFLVLAALTFHLRTSAGLQLVLWGGILAIGFITSFVWPGDLRHFGYVLILSLFVYWASGGGSESTSIFERMLQAVLAISVGVFALAAVRDVRGAYSGSAEMAEFLRRSGMAQVDIAAHKQTTAEAVLPYLPGKKFWYAGMQQYGSFMRWDVTHERGLRTSYPDAVRNAQREFAGRPYLLLLSVKMPDPERNGFRLVYATTRPVYEKTDEQYWLYAPLTDSTPPRALHF